MAAPYQALLFLCGKFRRISQLWDNAHSLNLEDCLLYSLSTISQFFDFVRCIVFDFIFYCLTLSHTPHCGQTTGYARDLRTSGDFRSLSRFITKFPRSTSFTRAISVLNPIILPPQTPFSRVLLLGQQAFSSGNLHQRSREEVTFSYFPILCANISASGR